MLTHVRIVLGLLSKCSEPGRSEHFDLINGAPTLQLLRSWVLVLLILYKCYPTLKQATKFLFMII